MDFVARNASVLVGLAVFAGVLGSGSALRGQEPGGVHLREFGGEVRLQGEFRDEKSVNPSGLILDQREWWTREALRFDFLGDIYHPRFLDIEALIDLLQDKIATRSSEL